MQVAGTKGALEISL